MNEELMTKVFTKLLVPIIKEQSIIKEKSINVPLNSLSKSVSDLKSLVLQMQRANESNATTSLGIDNDLKDDNMKIPCSGLADFAKFNGKLDSDENYHNKARRLASLANPNQALTRSTTPMIRLEMSRDVALKFNLKKANEKRPKIFIGTPFYKLIQGILVKKFSKSVDDPLSDAAINESISSVLNHCGDWEGGRNQRKQKSKKETSAANEHLDANTNNEKKILILRF
ncbi:uncharacterized protein LOC141525401 [Cotesia typhae]|uniref:uncharacterized protein LOC141525401 n=1 Tax=Cotesia typhae TaxID=2053667 RepID=UPI003D693685